MQIEERLLTDYQLLLDQVDIWFVDVDLYFSKIPEYIKILSIRERVRADQFKIDKDRYCYIISHAFLRILLGKYLNCVPELIEYEKNEYGKPFLGVNHQCIDIFFNMSHSRSKVLIAVTKETPLGIDIEYLNKNVLMANIAKRFFSPFEYSEFNQLPDDQKAIGFYNAWTRKEAFIKAKGKGIHFPLNKFAVSLSPEKEAKLLLIEGEQSDGWKLYGFNPIVNYPAAICWQGADKRLYYYDVTDFFK